MASRVRATQDARARVAEMRRQRARRDRRRRIAWITAVVVLLAAVGITLGITLPGRGEQPIHGTGPSVHLASLRGLQTTKAPWHPEYANLQQRLTTLQLPPSGNEAFHIHAHLASFINGNRTDVPTNIGIDVADQIGSPMHTHDDSGVIHVEAAQRSDAFTLGGFSTSGVSSTRRHSSVVTARAAARPCRPTSTAARYATRPGTS